MVTDRGEAQAFIVLLFVFFVYLFIYVFITIKLSSLRGVGSWRLLGTAPNAFSFGFAIKLRAASRFRAPESGVRLLVSGLLSPALSRAPAQPKPNRTQGQ